MSDGLAAFLGALREAVTDRVSDRAPDPDRPRVEPALERRADAPEAHATGNRHMFDRIAPTYDRVNRIMSLGIDRGWRERTVARLGEALARDPAPAVLDLCAGTMDFAAMLEETYPKARVVACDASPKMLALGRAKVRSVEDIVGDALALPFDDGSFSAVVCGFGMRNLADLRRGVREARRVLRPGGVFATLELFRPRARTTRLVHGAGLRYVLPVVGAAFAKDREAYAYLAESMEGFVTRDDYAAVLADEGFERTQSFDLTLGIVSIVEGHAPSAPGASS